MVDNTSLDKKLNNVLERLQYLRMTISNLKDRDGTLITEVGEIDERLFREIADYEISTEELKKDFVLLLLEDAIKLANMCVINPELSKKNSEELDKIESVLKFIFNHETDYIQKSKELQDFVMEARDDLKNIRKDMESKVRDKERQEGEYRKTWSRHNQLGFG